MSDVLPPTSGAVPPASAARAAAPSRAIEHLREVLARAPARQRLTDDQAEALYCQGYAQMGTGNWGLAVDHFEMLAIYRPDHPRYLRALGLAYRQDRRLEQALQVQRMLDALAPGDPVHGMDLAETLIALGRRGAALIALEMTKVRCGSDPARVDLRRQAQALQDLLRASEESVHA